MPHIDWVKGLSLPSDLSSPGSPPSAEVVAWMLAQLKEFCNGFESVACVLTEDGRVFFGVQQKHAHPNCFGSPIEVAAGIACTSGEHTFLAAGVYQPERRYVFSGVDLERLAEHFPRTSRGTKGDMLLFRASSTSEESFQHSSRLPEPQGGENRPDVRPDSAFAYAKFELELTLEDVLESRLPKDFVRYVDGKLRTIYLANSTADGRTKPGRKRHASCVFTPDGHLFFGVNLRSDVEACDRCSEWNAIGAAFVAGMHEQLVGAIVYSPDYKHGRVECCGKCRNSLESCIHPKFGDMLIRYVESGRPPRLWLYSQMPNTSYRAAEGS